jgi:hypothetical protein
MEFLKKMYDFNLSQKSNWVVIDVGFNIGATTIFFSRKENVKKYMHSNL